MTRRSMLIALMIAPGTAVVRFALAQKVAAPVQEDEFALANEDVKELLLLMDKDKNGKISKQEWMNFMEAEFNRLDKAGSGELDPNELRQSGISTRRSRPCQPSDRR